ncbi:MAG: hypothetical protein WCP91_01335 [Candidatus Berkelbacteria bacterium]
MSVISIARNQHGIKDEKLVIGLPIVNCPHEIMKVYIKSNMNQEINEKRKEIKEEFEELLAEHGSPFTFDHILDIINYENDTDDMMKIVRIFDRGNPMELENVLELATDAWNYFPHKILKGKSPAEMV